VVVVAPLPSPVRVLEDEEMGDVVANCEWEVQPVNVDMDVDGVVGLER